MTLREKLFDKTQVGMRVIIAPNDAEPVEFSDPVLFAPNAEAIAAAPARAMLGTGGIGSPAEGFAAARRRARPQP